MVSAASPRASATATAPAITRSRVSGVLAVVGRPRASIPTSRHRGLDGRHPTVQCTTYKVRSRRTRVSTPHVRETHPGGATDRPGSTMRAVVQDRYGPADVLRMDDVEVPAVAADQVLVRVHAAGIDRGTLHLMTGRPWVARAIGGVRRPRRRVPGLDLAGVVVHVGADVTWFAPGDAVFGTGLGSLAEYAAAPGSTLAAMPAGCSFTDASVLGVSGLTALQAV